MQAELYQRHRQHCCASEFRKHFLQSKPGKKSHILGTVKEKDLYKYKGKMQQLLLLCFGLFVFLSKIFIILSDIVSSTQFHFQWVPLALLVLPCCNMRYFNFKFVWGGRMLTQIYFQKSLTGAVCIWQSLHSDLWGWQPHNPAAVKPYLHLEQVRPLGTECLLLGDLHPCYPSLFWGFPLG